MKQVIEANKAELGKVYLLINTRKGENENINRQVEICQTSSCYYYYSDYFNDLEKLLLNFCQAYLRLIDVYFPFFERNTDLFK